MSFCHLHQRAERHHLTFRVAGLEAGDVLSAVAELGVGLRNDLIGAAKTVEVVHVKRAEINLHRLEKILQRHALLLGLYAINVRVQLRHVHREGRKRAGQSGCLITLADDALDVLVERVVAKVGAVFDEKLETANRAEAHHRRRRHGENERVLD